MRCRMLSILCLLLISSASWAEKHDLTELYDQLDNAIEHTADYVKVRQERITKDKSLLAKGKDAHAKYKASFMLYEEYRSYKNDSAVYYLMQSIDYADQAKDVKAANDAKALLAFQSSTTGKYYESYSILSNMDTTLLDAKGRRDYLMACQHLYSELSYYANIPKLRMYYAGKAQVFYASLLKELKHDDDFYLQLLEVDCRNNHQFKKAMAYNDQRLKMAKDDSHQYGIVAFYRAMIYKSMDNIDEAKYWLLKSALLDVKLAVMDQGSLWEIANLLSYDPNGLQRSYRYIKFAWQAANTFNTAVRSSQIMPVLSTIEDSYQTELSNSNQRLKIMIGFSVILIIIVLSLLFYVNKQRKRLAMAHDDLQKANANLKEVNDHLYESNKMKEVYIGRFLRLSANYMDKLETMRKRVAKLVKNREFVKLNAMLQSNEEDMDEFYEYFDSAFLKLFPDFVKDFNDLLRPEERIVLPEENKLTTTIRIFALIRLGIEDSSKIAEFLHYSVNTIYNYRAKVKNGALCDRDSFEEKVKLLGMK